MKAKTTIAIAGNLYSGKASVFNLLTGLRQKIGNFSDSMTIKKSGRWLINDDTSVTIIDLPDQHSIYSKTRDEQIVVNILFNAKHPDFLDMVILVVDTSNLRRNLLLVTQLADLSIPVVLVLNKTINTSTQPLEVNAVQLAMRLSIPVVRLNIESGEGLGQLKKAVLDQLHQPIFPERQFFEPPATIDDLIFIIKDKFQLDNKYVALQYAMQYSIFLFLNQTQRRDLDALVQKYHFNSFNVQAEETIERIKHIDRILDGISTNWQPDLQSTLSYRLDRLLLHPLWGTSTFVLILLLIFQAIFAWAQPFMDGLDSGVAWLNGNLKESLPGGPITDLLTDGILAGLGGILVFIPQIGFMFLIMELLEESGYLARVMVTMDRLVSPFGLSGRSLIPLVSGIACAVPAVIATRNIRIQQDRLITILVTPFMSCSARLPIYTILIALVVPPQRVLGIFNLQGLTLMGLYLLGLLGALILAFVLKLVFKTRERRFGVIELPDFKMPRWNYVGLKTWQNLRFFVWNTGRTILAISIILWVLASYGNGNTMDEAETRVRHQNKNLPVDQLDNRIASERLEASYAGKFGHFIEPVIRPLGYDWKIGIALLSSFAAREVFVGTMSTIYSIGSGTDEEGTTIRERLRQERNPKTGGPMYTPAVAFSLLIFYVFALMCMSTIATVYQETNRWEWPACQFLIMTGFGYLAAFLVYRLLS